MDVLPEQRQQGICDNKSNQSRDSLVTTLSSLWGNEQQGELLSHRSVRAHPGKENKPSGCAHTESQHLGEGGRRNRNLTSTLGWKDGITGKIKSQIDHTCL